MCGVAAYLTTHAMLRSRCAPRSAERRIWNSAGVHPGRFSSLWGRFLPNTEALKSLNSWIFRCVDSKHVDWPCRVECHRSGCVPVVIYDATRSDTILWHDIQWACYGTAHHGSFIIALVCPSMYIHVSCMYACVTVCLHVCMHMHARMYACMHACMHVSMHA